MSATYGREALRRLRQRQKEADPAREQADDTVHHWIDVPRDAPMDNATLTVWNGERFVAWKEWLATAREEGPPEGNEQGIPPAAVAVAATCGSSRIVLAREGDRWLMYAGVVRPANRRKDFATPFLGHAIRTAEAWYGVPVDGWRVETKAHGKR